MIGYSDQMPDIGFTDDSNVHSFIRHLLCAFAVLGTLPGTRGYRIEYSMVLALEELSI